MKLTLAPPSTQSTRTSQSSAIAALAATTSRTKISGFAFMSQTCQFVRKDTGPAYDVRPRTDQRETRNADTPPRHAGRPGRLGLARGEGRQCGPASPHADLRPNLGHVPACAAPH